MMTPFTKRLGSFAALTAMMLSTSCIFDTRDADPPEPGGGGCVLDSPQKPFGCMKAALAELKDGDYERSISDRFVFSPTTADSLDQNFAGTCVYEGWNKDVEIREHIQFLVADSEELTWDYTLVPEINKNTFVRYVVEYSLRVRTVAAPTDTTVYRGLAKIDVRNESGNWRITFWDEQQTVPGSSTWGFLRGVTRLQQGGGDCLP